MPCTLVTTPAHIYLFSSLVHLCVPTTRLKLLDSILFIPYLQCLAHRVGAQLTFVKCYCVYIYIYMVLYIFIIYVVCVSIHTYGRKIIDIQQIFKIKAWLKQRISFKGEAVQMFCWVVFVKAYQANHYEPYSFLCVYSLCLALNH